MNITAITIFPRIFQAYLSESIIGKAIQRGLVRIDVLDLRDFATDRHRKVDDAPYGGGPGMVMMPEPFARAIEHVLSDGRETHTVLVSPQGRPFTQARAEALSRGGRRLLLLAGRYEGIDERIREAYVNEDISVGDYVLTGGELPALVIIDAVVRLLPGVVGDEDSLSEESFAWGILDYPHYTRPAEWRGRRVPDVLLTGHHAQIERFRRKEALRRTLRVRPDLLPITPLERRDRELLEEIEKEDAHGLGSGG